MPGADDALLRSSGDMSAVTPIADKRGFGWIVRFVPIGDIARLILNEEGRQLRRPFVALTD